MTNPLIIVALVFGVLSLFFFWRAARARRRDHKRLRGMATHGTFGLLMLTTALLFATLSISTWGYRALTREEVVLVVTTVATGPQQFDADVEFPDGRRQTYVLAGDEFYVDARILKWKPMANLFGLHTDYELDRIAGRYTSLSDEQSLQRTVHGLGRPKPLDLFQVRRTYSWLAPLVDAEYGSATFVPTADRGRFEVSVSTSGLLVRRVEAR